MSSSIYDVTNKIVEILNNAKDVEVAATKPASGSMLIKYNEIYFTITLKPLYAISETKDS